jgi:hypothetical protein
MSQFASELRQTIVPGRNTRHGPLPPVLVAMTLVTGLVDAFSYLVLGHVFVANMTGNVVLLGFALVGAPGFSIAASIAAIAALESGRSSVGRLVHGSHQTGVHSSALRRQLRPFSWCAGSSSLGSAALR